MSKTGENKIKVIIFLLFIVGCSEKPMVEMSTDNPNVMLSLLFTHNGCNIYRFRDAGHNRYFSDCRGSITSRRCVSQGNTCYEQKESTVNIGR